MAVSLAHPAADGALAVAPLRHMAFTRSSFALHRRAV
jgi:hypothetical protein